MEENIVNNEHKSQYIACSIHVNHTGKFSNPTYSYELPEKLVQLGMTPELFNEFINEANEQVKLRWWPNMILWSCLCCIPIFCCNQQYKDVSHHMEQFCEKWNSSGRLPKGMKLIYDIQIKKFNIGGGGFQRMAEFDTWHNIFFMVTSN